MLDGSMEEAVPLPEKRPTPELPTDRLVGVTVPINEPPPPPPPPSSSSGSSSSMTVLLTILVEVSVSMDEFDSDLPDTGEDAEMHVLPVH